MVFKIVIVTFALLIVIVIFKFISIRFMRVGYVFLSWTVRNPRDNAAMKTIIESLDLMNIDYYDYTRFQVDDSKDIKKEISIILEQAIKRCNCSVEIISSDILFHEWVQHERSLLRRYNKKRYFICLEQIFLERKGKKEDLITRLDFSGGEYGGILADRIDERSGFDNKRYMSTDYFSSREFGGKCMEFAYKLRKELLEMHRKNGAKWRFYRT